MLKFDHQTKMNMNTRLPISFFLRDVLDVAPDLLGKVLVRRFHSGETERYVITETEAYRGGEDKACHANKGKTPRTEVMFCEGGVVYVYLVYGMHWMLNFVTGPLDDSSAVLIRGLEGISGPGRVGKALGLDNSFYGENLMTSQRLWIENSVSQIKYATSARIGIDYAGEPWVSKPWRFMIDA